MQSRFYRTQWFHRQTNYKTDRRNYGSIKIKKLTVQPGGRFNCKLITFLLVKHYFEDKDLYKPTTTS